MKPRGGADRGQGRKPLSESGTMLVASIRLTKPQKKKLDQLGGAQWVRKKIDEA